MFDKQRLSLPPDCPSLSAVSPDHSTHPVAHHPVKAANGKYGANEQGFAKRDLLLLAGAVIASLVIAIVLISILSSDGGDEAAPEERTPECYLLGQRNANEGETFILADEVPVNESQASLRNLLGSSSKTVCLARYEVAEGSGSAGSAGDGEGGAATADEDTNGNTTDTNPAADTEDYIWQDPSGRQYLYKYVCGTEARPVSTNIKFQEIYLNAETGNEAGLFDAALGATVITITESTQTPKNCLSKYARIIGPPPPEDDPIQQFLEEEPAEDSSIANRLRGYYDSANNWLDENLETLSPSPTP